MLNNGDCCAGDSFASDSKNVCCYVGEKSTSNEDCCAIDMVNSKDFCCDVSSVVFDSICCDISKAVFDVDNVVIGCCSAS